MSSQLRLLRPTLLLLLLLALCASSARAVPLAPDPVEEFRVFLKTNVYRLGQMDRLIGDAEEQSKRAGESTLPDKQQRVDYYNDLKAKLTQERKSAPTEAAKKFGQLTKQLTTVGQLARVVRLGEWQDSTVRTGLGVLRAAEGVDLLEEISRMFTDAVRKLAETGTPAQRAELARLLGEEAMVARANKIRGEYRRKLMSALVPVVVKLSQEKGPENRGVREMATLALGSLDAKAETQVDAVKTLLAADGASADARLVAYRALAEPYRIYSPRYQTIEYTTEAEVSLYRNEGRNLIEQGGQLAVPLLAAGLKDPDPRVRAASVETLRDLSSILLSAVPEPPLLRGDTNPAFEYLRQTNEQIKRLTPLRQRLQEHTPAVVDFSRTAAPPLRLQALGVLDDLISTRTKLRRLRQSLGSDEAALGREGAAVLPVQAKEKEDPPAKDDPLGSGFQKALPELTRNLFDPDPRIRLATMEILLEMGRDAAPALPDVVAALRDPNKFVRWDALRLLARFGGADPERVVAAITPMLCDPDPDLDKAAAATLDEYGPAAGAAVPALARGLQHTDVDVRAAFLHTLVTIGTASADALPAVAGMLRDEDPRNRAAAAETLARFGALAAGAVPALRAALNDPDPDVRRAVSEALLSIAGK